MSTNTLSTSAQKIAERLRLADTPFLPDDERMRDMDDGYMLDKLEWPASPRLRAALDYCRQTLEPAYQAANARALRNQTRHRRITIAAAVTGGVAVVVAIAQLTPLRHSLVKDKWVAAFEALMAVCALTSVLLGVLAALRDNWLLERHRAERLRLLKFKALFEPPLFAAQDTDLQTWRKWLDDELARIQALRSKPAEHTPAGDTEAQAEGTMTGWVEAEPSLDVPDKWRTLQVASAELLDLLKYYNLKRLEVQCTYFYDRAHRRVKLDTSTRHVPVYAFFGSVAAALLHFLLDFFGLHEPNEAAVPFWQLIFLAAALPIIGATFRTIRSANEFSRNTIRYQAKLTSLLLHADKLEREAATLKAAGHTSLAAGEIERICLELWGCEQDLEAEHREWLRLMIEAEWFG